MGKPELPIFPSEKQIAELVVGPERARDWPEIARTLEKRGFPKIDPLHGGRKLQSVLAWYEDPTRAPIASGLPAPRPAFNIVPYEPDGEEDFHAQTKNAGRRRTACRDRRSGS